MANKRFLNPINLVNLASDPGTASEGDIYYNTTADVVKVYANGAWVAIGAGGSGSEITVSTTAPSSPTTGDAWYKNDTGEFYIWDGTFWVEVNGVVEANGALTGITSIENPDYITFDTTPETSSSEIGTLFWNETEGTLDLKLNSETTLQIGQEQHVRVHNGTGSSIPNGTVVYVNGAADEHGHISIAPYIADGSVNVFNVMGITTMVIPDGTDGYVTLSGLVHGIDTSEWSVGQGVFASDTVPGGLTTTQPISPSETVSLGVITKSDIDGTIFVQIDTGQTADLVTYNHTTSLLEATNVKAALDELAYTKADVNALASSLVIYPTSVESNISGYYRMVESIDDTDYDDTAVDISTGNLNGTGLNHLISSLVSDAGLFVGTPGSINITTIGNIRKTSGNANAYSEFFFRVYKRTSGGTETLLGTSSATGAVNPTTLNNYEQFSASGNFLLSNFTATDRLVIKYYSNVLDDGTQSYQFQFGGQQPVRTLVPVPISVTPASNASGTFVDTTNFNGVLSGADSTVQAALETIDDIVTIPDQTGNSGKFLTTTGSVVEWSSSAPLDTSSTEQTKAGNLIITGNLTVNGTTTTINSTAINVNNQVIFEGSTPNNFETTLTSIDPTADNTISLPNASGTLVLTNSPTFTGSVSVETDIGSSGSELAITNDTKTSIKTLNNSVVVAQSTGITLNSGGVGTAKAWVFKNNGDLTFPDNSNQSTAFLGISAYDTDDIAEGTNHYFTNERAVSALASTLSDYLTTSSASSTYLTQSSASSTYQPLDQDLTDIAALTGNGILKKTAGVWAMDTTEYATTGDISSAVGDYIPLTQKGQEQGVAELDIDGFVPVSQLPDLSATYSATSHNHTLNSLSNVVITGTPTDGQAIVWDTTTSKWVNETVSGGASYPDQTGNTGKFLQTDGSTVSWQDVDLSAYLTTSTAASTYQPLDSDLTAIAALSSDGILKKTSGTWAMDTSTYLTSESDTLETVTDRGASSSNAITISNTTQSTTPTSGALIISGGVGIAKDVWIDGDLHVNGTTVTENTKTVSTNDNLIYLNASQDSVVTNAVGNGTYVTYTAENNYTPGMDIRVTEMNPSGYNISSADNKTIYSATSTQFVVAKTTTGSFVSGGTAHAKEEVNPDLGFAGGYYTYSDGYAHAGLFRDASDGLFKFFQGYTPEPDEAVNIDTDDASFELASISIKGITSLSSNYSIGIGYLSGNFFGNGNYAFGSETLSANSGEGNYGIGSLTLVENIGHENYAIGTAALQSNTGNNNYAFGYLAGRDNTGSDNLFLGHEAGNQAWLANSGNYNVYIGKTYGLSTSNNIVIADNEGNLRAQYLSADFGWTLGTIYSATWNGSAIDYQYGGTGLTSLGTAGQVLTVNAGATALEWADASGGGSSFTNSSELAALLSDETGSGSVVFSASASLTAPTISGGTINNASIGATTASTGKFTSVNINGQAIIEGSTGTTSATSSFNTTTYSSAEFIVYGSTASGNYVSKVLMLARGTSTPVITEYAILTQGTAPTVTITPSYSAPNAVLTVAVTSGTNIEIIATEVSI
jgi:hypothetical protein